MAERPPFVDQLRAKWDEGKFVCVNLDADWSKLPLHLKNLDRSNSNLRYRTTFDFFEGIVRATADTVLAYKFNSAFLEDSPQAMDALKRGLDFIHSKYPNVPIIGDVKRADIGNTNKGYAKAMFERYGFDAITSNAQYFGSDTFPPFLEDYPDRGLFIMAKTSNPGSRDIQNLRVEPIEALIDGIITQEAADELSELFPEKNPRVYEMVTYIASTRWNTSGQLGLVVGGTAPETFAEVRRLAGDMPFLVPGIGAQGGGEKDLRMIWANGLDRREQGVIIASGREIIFASNGEDFAEAARAKTLALHGKITDIRNGK